MGHRFASAPDERCKRNYAKDAKTPPIKGGVYLLGSGGVIALAVDRQPPVAGPAGALRASQIAPGDLVAAQLCRPAMPASECTVPTVLASVRLK